MKGLGRWLAGLTLLLAALQPAQAEADRISLYPGYSNGQRLLVEGRIVEARSAAPVREADSRLTNLWRNLGHFFNDERQGQPLQLHLQGQVWPLVSDAEGYFSLDTPHPPLAPGWHQIMAESRGHQGQGRLLVVPRENRLGLISDLDDTLLISEVTRKHRLLGNTFLKNPAQRQVVPGTAALLARVAAANPQPEAAPLFYLSASPRQLQDGIADFLERNAFPAGVLLTKQIREDGGGDPLLDQFTYKTRKIEGILARLPGVRFLLLGDDGEKDPEIYAWIQKLYPERVAGIWIRRVSPPPRQPLPPGQRDLAEVLAATSLPELAP